jgi:hypothetical protein
MASSGKGFAGLLVLAGALLGLSGEAHAIPAFAREYGLACSACHEVFSDEPTSAPHPEPHPEVHRSTGSSVIRSSEIGLVPFRDNEVVMHPSIRTPMISILLLAASTGLAQSSYQVVSVSNSGTIRGAVKWSGPQPHELSFLINKDNEVCDPGAQKKRDLERLVIGPQGGVANTVVYLKNISRGKAMDIPAPRRFLDQKHCQIRTAHLAGPARRRLANEEFRPGPAYGSHGRRRQP